MKCTARGTEKTLTVPEPRGRVWWPAPWRSGRRSWCLTGSAGSA